MYLLLTDLNYDRCRQTLQIMLLLLCSGPAAQAYLRATEMALVNPTGDTRRCEYAAIMMRFIENVVK